MRGNAGAACRRSAVCTGDRRIMSPALRVTVTQLVKCEDAALTSVVHRRLAVYLPCDGRGWGAAVTELV